MTQSAIAEYLSIATELILVSKSVGRLQRTPKIHFQIFCYEHLLSLLKFNSFSTSSDVIGKVAAPFASISRYDSFFLNLKILQPICFAVRRNF